MSNRELRRLTLARWTARGCARRWRRFRDRTIAVVGDLIVDEYLFGKPARISREAPVLILRFTERDVRLGGAANAAHNVHALGRAGRSHRRRRARTAPARRSLGLFRRGRHADRRDRGRARPDDAREDADHGRRLSGHATAGRAPRPRARRRAAAHHRGRAARARLPPCAARVDAILVSDYGYGTRHAARLRAHPGARAAHRHAWSPWTAATICRDSPG